MCLDRFQENFGTETHLERLLLLLVRTANTNCGFTMYQALGRNPGCKLLAVQPWACYLITLCFSFFLCKTLPTLKS